MERTTRILPYSLIGVLTGALVGSLLIAVLQVRNFVPIAVAATLIGGVLGVASAFIRISPLSRRPGLSVSKVMSLWPVLVGMLLLVGVPLNLMIAGSRPLAIHGAVDGLLAILLLVLVRSRRSNYGMQAILFALFSLNGIVGYLITGAGLLWWEIGLFGAGAIAAGFVSRHKDLVKGFLETYDRS